jgi:hypothetical protein
VAEAKEPSDTLPNTQMCVMAAMSPMMMALVVITLRLMGSIFKPVSTLRSELTYGNYDRRRRVMMAMAMATTATAGCIDDTTFHRWCVVPRAGGIWSMMGMVAGRVNDWGHTSVGARRCVVGHVQCHWLSLSFTSQRGKPG